MLLRLICNNSVSGLAMSLTGRRAFPLTGRADPRYAPRVMTSGQGNRRNGWWGSRLVLAALLAALLAGCVERADRPRPRRALPATSLPAAGSAEHRQCLARLDAAGVRYAPLRDEDRGGGCALRGAVQLLDIGVTVSNLGPMSCAVAVPFSAWARFAVQPAARLYLGSEIARIETYGTYACRNVRGAGGPARLSEHSQANAVDVSAFVLADGRRLSVLSDWATQGPARQFLSALHQSACRRFRTVLSPDYNTAHRDHFHFDMGGSGGFCR